jgi:acetyl esterase/lipase
VSTSPFHPDLRRAAAVLPRAVVSERTLPLVRAGYRLLSLVPSRGVSVVRVSPHAEMRVFRPKSAPPGPRPALLWIHGGGYVIGRAQQDDGVCRRFADELGIVVASVDYRLAPEAPFPAALDDCLAALQHLAVDPSVDAERIAVGGASAGGGLAAALALRARDEGGPALAFQLLAYPMIDDRTAVRGDLDATHVRAWSPTSNVLGWRSYLGTRSPGAEDVPPLAAPARAQDLTGLPPAWIGVGTMDLFHDEDQAYAARLDESGVPCSLTVVPGAFHGFDILVPWAGVSRDFGAAQRDALRAALQP